jgi:hypothetical protein
MITALACRITVFIIAATSRSTGFHAPSSLPRRLVVGSGLRRPQPRIETAPTMSRLAAAASNNGENESTTVVPPQSVQVCQSKDCRRRGGAQRLLGQIQAVRNFPHCFDDALLFHGLSFYFTQ